MADGSVWNMAPEASSGLAMQERACSRHTSKVVTMADCNRQGNRWGQKGTAEKQEANLYRDRRDFVLRREGGRPISPS